MLFIMAILFVLVLLIGIPVVIITTCWHMLWGKTGRGLTLGKMLILLSGVVLICLPVVVAKNLYAQWEYSLHRQRVPSPLEYEAILYRAEEGCCFGPGANEGGLIIYSLTKASTTLLRDQTENLDDLLPIGNEDAMDAPNWLPTPIKDLSFKPGHSSRTSETGIPPGGTQVDVKDYVNTYYTVDIDPAMRDQVNAVINAPGAYYRLGRGGKVTVISSDLTQLYVFYAG